MPLEKELSLPRPRWGGEVGQVFDAGDGGFGGVVVRFVPDGGSQPSAGLAIRISQEGRLVKANEDADDYFLR